MTPEGVLLDMPVAGVVSRAIAKFIDLLCLGALAFVVMIGVTFVLSQVDAQPMFYITMMGTAAFALAVGIPAGVEYLMKGRSPGKVVLGLRVVTLAGGPIGPMAAFLRALALPLVDLVAFAFPVGLMSVLATHWSQRVGDLLSGTMVITDRKVATRAVAASFFPPVGTDSIVASLDTSALTPDQYHVVRTMLVRAPQLTVAARTALADQLASDVCGVLRVNLPPGLASEPFLACVASAYQLRGGGHPVQPIVSSPVPWGTVHGVVQS